MLLLFNRNPYTGNNAFYTQGITLLGGGIDWDTDTIKCVLVDTALYIPDFDTDNYLDDIASAARISTATLSGVAVSKESVTASSTTFTAVTGSTVEGLVIYRDTGSEATSELIAFINEGDTLFPYTPSGVDLTVTWQDGEVLRLAGATRTPWRLEGSDWPYLKGIALGTYSNGSGVDLVLTVPSNVESGDMMIAVLCLRSGTPTCPAGWDWIVATSAAADGVSGRYMAWKLAGASEPTTYTWTIAGGTDRIGQIVSFGGSNGVIVDGQTTVTEATSGARRAIWVGCAAHNTGNNAIVPFFNWTNVTKAAEWSYAGIRHGVSTAFSRVDNGAAITTLSPSVSASGAVDAECSFILESAI